MAEKNPDTYRGYLQRRGKFMETVTTSGVVKIVGMGFADRSVVGTHSNVVRNYSQTRNSTGLLRKRTIRLESFRGVTVTGYRTRDTNAPLETFELEWDPTKINARNRQGELDYVQIYSDTTTSLISAA